VDNWNVNGVMNRLNRGINDHLILAGEFVEGAAKLGCPVKSGNLRDSIKRSNPVNGHISVGTNVEYAPIVELGGTITPTKANALAIPLNAEAKKLYGSYTTLRDVPGLFVLSRPGKSALLVKKEGKGIKPLFVLKDEVNRKADPFLLPALVNNKTTIRKIMEL